MLLPLMGAAFAGRMGAGFLEEWEEDRDIKRQGERNTALDDQLGPSFTGDQYARAAARQGTLSPLEMLQQGFTDQRQAAQDAAAMDRTRAGLGPQWARIRMEEEAISRGITSADNKRQADEWLIGRYGTPQERDMLTNPFATSEYTNGIAGNVRQRVSPSISEAGQILTNERAAATQAGVIDATNAQNQGVVQTQQDAAAMRAQEDAMLREDGFVDDVYFTPGTPAREMAVNAAYQGRGMTPANPIVASIDEALRVLPGASFDRRAMSNEESINTTNYLNEVMGQVRMAHWNKTLGRTDAPNDAEMEDLMELFPRIEPNFWTDGNRRREIGKIFERAKVRASGGTPGGDLTGSGWNVD